VDVDADLQAVTPTPRATVGGVAVLAAGLFTVLLGVQTYWLTRFEGAVTWIIPTMWLLGSLTVVCGWYIRRLRAWAAMGGALTSVFIAVCGMVWVVYSFMNGLFSLLALMVVPIAATSVVASAINVGPARRAEQARRRLAESDLRF
jgi:hypothetical protein